MIEDKKKNFVIMISLSGFLTMGVVPEGWAADTVSDSDPYIHTHRGDWTPKLRGHLFEKDHNPITHGISELREKLEEKGITSEIVYTGEAAFNTTGGIKTDSTYVSNLDITLTLDTANMGLWDGGTLFVYGLNNHTSEPLTGAIVGDLQGVSNIESPRTTRLFELWYEQRFSDEAFSILLGLHDLNTEFAVTEYGGMYLNSSFGISPDISANARPSIFPLSWSGCPV